MEKKKEGGGGTMLPTYKHSTTAKYWLIDLYGNTQFKPNLTEADNG